MRRTLALIAPFLALASPAAADCSAAINKSFADMYAAVPFRSELIVKGNELVVRTISEVALPEAIRVKTQATDKTEIVMIGERVWRDTGEGEGIAELPTEIAPKIAAAIRASHGKPLADLKNTKCTETESRAGRDYRVYEYEQDFKIAGNDGRSTARLLVDAANGLPSFMEVTSTAMGVMSLSLMTIIYDKALKVAPPEVKAPVAAGAPAAAPPAAEKK